MAQRDFATSDTHFLHKMVAGKRGFEDVAEHDKTIIANWNRVVRPGDRAWLLGDVSLQAPELFWPLVDQLNGEKHLITGNHDAVAAQHTRSHRSQREWMDHFASVQPYARVRLEGRDVLLSHYPYMGDHPSLDRPDGRDRYTQYRLRDEGLTLLHGHTHGKEQVTRSPRGSLQIHVGLDAHDLTPVPMTWVQKVIRERDASAELTRLGEELDAPATRMGQAYGWHTHDDGSGASWHTHDGYRMHKHRGDEMVVWDRTDA